MLHLSPWQFLLSALTYLLLYTYTSYEEREMYIVFRGDLPARGMEDTELHHMSMVEKVLGSELAPQHLLHSYKNLNGFVARLTQEESNRMKELDGVLSVLPNEKHQLQTTKSWDFIGFPQSVSRSSSESDIIVGVIDTGIWPESRSFDDQGFGSVPTKWKGSCDQNIKCNKKLIGAQYSHIGREFKADDERSPRDTNGHGSHCASIAAGDVVKSVNLYGFGSGTVRGGVPSARIAAYKVCWSDGCTSADILAGFDKAISDGVDIISVSLSYDSIYDVKKYYYQDIFAIGAFHAFKKNILTSKGAGNFGEYGYHSMTDFAPWSISVAASSIDRKFNTKVQLGNKVVYEGISLNTFDDLKNKVLIYAGDAPNTKAGFDSSKSKSCKMSNCLDEELVKGKILVCEGLGNGAEQMRSGAIGLILIKKILPTDAAGIFALPATQISNENGKQVLSYIRSTSNPTATILKSTEASDSSAPFVPTFSSKGPNEATPDILKPDIVAPGVHILAAYSPKNPISKVQGDPRFVDYTMLSGTSMATAHVTAIVAYVKSFHVDWSPAAIKSALMTTATPMNSKINEEAEFAYGSGNLNPIKAVNPGLIYDISVLDYEKFLCGQGYTDAQIKSITDDSKSCKDIGSETVWNLNLPSFALKRDASSPINRVFTRTVKNVGEAKSTYKATVNVPSSSSSLSIKVEPSVLSFTSVGEKKSFTVTIKGSTTEEIVSASLVWDNGKVQVRSPIVIYLLV